MSRPGKSRPRVRFSDVRAPKPLLSRESERRLSARQLELLEELEAKLVRGGLGELTMSEIASDVGCSLRTLYGIAPSKDELLLLVVDRRLHRIGRAAVDVLEAGRPPLETLRAYLRATNEAVQPESVVLSADLGDVVGAGALFASHEGYLSAVAKSLLDRAVAAGDVGPVDTAAIAHVLGGLGREFARPEVVRKVRGSAKETADHLTELLLDGLPPGRNA